LQCIKIACLFQYAKFIKKKIQGTTAVTDGSNRNYREVYDHKYI